MYSQFETRATALLAVVVVATLVGSSLFAGAAAGATGASDASPQGQQQLDGVTQEWCINYVNSNVLSDLPEDVACSAVEDISRHQKISLDYSLRNQGPNEYVTVSLGSDAIQPAKANISVSVDGETVATYENADESLAFVDERHYNILAEEYSTDKMFDGDASTTSELEAALTTSTVRTVRDTYTQEEIELMASTNLTKQELTNLRFYQLDLRPGEVDAVQATHLYEASDFDSEDQQFDYTITIELSSRGSDVANTQFTVSRTVNQYTALNGDVADSTSIASTNNSSNTQPSQIQPDGFDIVLNETIETDISRYTDGTTEISPLQDPAIPPNSEGENSAVGEAKDVSNLREDSNRFPAVIYGSAVQDRLHFGSAYFGIPEAEYHYLILTYAFQGESAGSQAEVRFVDRQGDVIDQNEGARYLSETVNDSIDLSSGEQYEQAISSDTLTTERVIIPMTQREIRYVNDNYEAFVTYRTDGGEDTLLLYQAKIASTDVLQNGTDLPDANLENESDFQEDSATFNIEYRVAYDINPRFGQIDVLPGETFRIPVTIENSGDTRVERTIGLRDEFRENNLNYSEIVAERTVMVEPQSEKTIILEHTWRGYQHGNHSVTIFDTTNESAYEKVSSQEGENEYSVYVYQPPTFEIVGMRAPDSWVQYDHFKTLVAVQNVGDLSTDFYSDRPTQMPYIYGQFGPWKGEQTDFVEGGNVRAGDPGGTVNMYFSRDTDYTPDYPNPNQTYADDVWRNNAPYHLNNSSQQDPDKPDGENYGPFNLTVESVHPWAVIDGSNQVTGESHEQYITYSQMEAPQLDENDDVIYEDATPGDPFIDYYSNQKSEQNKRLIYKNELQKCHLAGNHTEYGVNSENDATPGWNETQIVDNCLGMIQQDVRIYNLNITTIRIRNETNEMVESRIIRRNGFYERTTPGDNTYYLSGWPYTETDPSTSEHTNVSNPAAIQMVQYDNGLEWSVDTFAVRNVLSKEEMNAILAEYANGEITRDDLRRQMLTEQAYQNGEPAFTDRGLQRALSCDGSTTSQLTPESELGTAPDCQGFGLQGQPIPATLIENAHLPTHETGGQKFYVDVHVVNDGQSSNAYARVKVTTNVSNAGINGTQVVGYGTEYVPPNSDRQLRIPVIMPNNASAVGDNGEKKHELRVQVRTEPDYSSYLYTSQGVIFTAEMTAKGWEDFNFKNLTLPSEEYREIDEKCDGVNANGLCENTSDSTFSSKFVYQNHGAVGGEHTLRAAYGFWATPTGEGSDWPTLHHREATERWQHRVGQDIYWLNTAPGSFQGAGSGSQIDNTQYYGPEETQTWFLQTNVSEPGIYRVYAIQERLNNEDVDPGYDTLSGYENTTYSMYSYSGTADQSAAQSYLNESHWEQFVVYDITDPVSRFYFESETYPSAHATSGSVSDSRDGAMTIWQGGTINVDGRERLDWTLSEFNDGIAQQMNVSSDNVGVETYTWTFSGGVERIYDQNYDNLGGSEEEGKISRRFDEPGQYTIELEVEDYTEYTEGGPNSNVSQQTVNVQNDNTVPDVTVTNPSISQNYGVDSTSTIWSGIPDDRSSPFTEVTLDADVSDNAIGVECKNTTETGADNQNACYWEKDEGSWITHQTLTTEKSITFTNVWKTETRQDDEICFRFFADDFADNENDDEHCVQVLEDTTEPNPEYSEDAGWVWADFAHADTNTDVTFDASASSDDGDSGEPAVGLHDEAYIHSAEGGDWQSSATFTTSYGSGASDYRTEYETVQVRDWYGNQDTSYEVDVRVYTDTDAPESDGCSPSSCYNEEIKHDGKPSGSAEDNHPSSWDYDASATTCITISERGPQGGGIGIHDVSASGDGQITSQSESSTTVCVTADPSASASASASEPSPPTPSTCGSTNTETNYDDDYESDSERASSTITVEDKHGNTGGSWSIEAYAKEDSYDTDSNTGSTSSDPCPTPEPEPEPCTGMGCYLNIESPNIDAEVVEPQF